MVRARTALFEQVEQRRAYRVIVDQVADRIQRGMLGPGDRLAPENELCAEFGVSRATLREALSALETLGLIQTFRGSRSVVVGELPAPQGPPERSPEPLGAWSPLDMWEARRLIEPGAAALAALRRQPADMDALERALDVYVQKARAGVPRAPYSFDFHLQVARTTQNAAVVSMLSVAMQREPSRWERAFKRMSPGLEAHRNEYLDQHTAIVDAIRAGDVEGAFQAMDTHIITVIQALS